MVGFPFLIHFKPELWFTTLLSACEDYYLMSDS